MKNVIFISPNFPTNYWMFCKELKENGLNVLGIGDQPYHELSPELKDSLTEYYKVDSLGNYDNVFKHFYAFFISVSSFLFVLATRHTRISTNTATAQSPPIAAGTLSIDASVISVPIVLTR